MFESSTTQPKTLDLLQTWAARLWQCNACVRVRLCFEKLKMKLTTKSGSSTYDVGGTSGAMENFTKILYTVPQKDLGISLIWISAIITWFYHFCYCQEGSILSRINLKTMEFWEYCFSECPSSNREHSEKQYCQNAMVFKQGAFSPRMPWFREYPKIGIIWPFSQNYHRLPKVPMVQPEIDITWQFDQNYHQLPEVQPKIDTPRRKNNS